MNNHAPLPEENAHDLTSCDREPIHLLGHVQSFGCLISVSMDWLINHVSTNTRDVIGLDPDALVGTRFSAHFPDDSAHKLRGKTQILTAQNPTTRCFSFDLFEDGRLFDIAIQVTPKGFIFEFEPCSGNTAPEDPSIVQALLARVRAQGDLPGMATEAARALRKITGFEKVMLYQFAPDGTGSVIAEARAAHSEPYLGLRFPASDIPKQARALYKRSPLRLIADVDGARHKVIPERGPDGKKPDLSLAITRAVSPTHLQYLRNMGVAASMSASIMRRGELWGLFACHHAAPHYVSYDTRTAVELFVQLFSYELSELLNEQERQAAEDAQTLHNRVMARVSSGNSLHKDLEALAEEISDAISFDGIALYSDGTYRTLGMAPDEADFLPMVRFLNTTSSGEVFATECIVERYPEAESFADLAAGILVLPISRRPRDYIVLFRRELTHFVNWAGKPGKVESGQTLSPRSSFAAWQEVVKRRSSPWLPNELNTARALRVTLVEVVLKITDQAHHERLKSQQDQELLIAELNHRVRNILNLISGLVGQSSQKMSSVESFTDVLDGRIQALARAHDQLTAKQWSPVSLKELIQVELRAYSSRRGPAVIAQGDDAFLVPEAVSTVTLVLHELVTNAAKYGALSNDDGILDIRLSQDASGALRLAWREIGGPPVKPPASKGFGTTIIEKTIPFELKGQVDARYRMAGFEADIVLPARYFTRVIPQGGSGIPEDAPAPILRPVLGGDVLLVEDTLLIAMHTSDMLCDLGAADVHSASTVREAMDILDTQHIHFAVLDVNLGDETSLMVAKRLSDSRIPFILATGYGSMEDVIDTYPKSPILKKPFQITALQRTIEDALLH